MAGSLGELEQLFLLALLQRGGEASGIDLREELDERTSRQVLPGAVYNIMERLLERGLVDAFAGDAAPERGGRRRKYYRMRPAGERALAESYNQVRRMAEGLSDRLRRALSALVLALATGLLAGLVPAVRLSRRASASAGGGGLSGLLRTRAGTGRGGGALVGVQFALATVLLVGAGLMVRSLTAIYDVDVGVRYEGAYAFGATFGEASYPTPDGVVAAVDDVVARLEARRDVEAAAAISHLPLSGAPQLVRGVGGRSHGARRR